MIRKHFNYFLAVLYRRNHATMKSSGDSAVVLIAKLQLALLPFVYVMPVVGALGRLFTHRQTDVHLTSSNRWDAVLELGAYFVPVHLLAWPTARLVAFAKEVENQPLLRQAQQRLVLLLVVGFILLVVLSKYNNGTLWN